MIQLINLTSHICQKEKQFEIETEHVNNQTDMVSFHQEVLHHHFVEHLKKTNLKLKMKVFTSEHQLIKMQQDVSSHSRAAVMAQNVADVVGGTIGLLARVSS